VISAAETPVSGLFGVYYASVTSLFILRDARMRVIAAIIAACATQLAVAVDNGLAITPQMGFNVSDRYNRMHGRLRQCT